EAGARARARTRGRPGVLSHRQSGDRRVSGRCDPRAVRRCRSRFAWVRKRRYFWTVRPDQGLSSIFGSDWRNQVSLCSLASVTTLPAALSRRSAGPLSPRRGGRLLLRPLPEILFAVDTVALALKEERVMYSAASRCRRSRDGSPYCQLLGWRV